MGFKKEVDRGNIFLGKTDELIKNALIFFTEIIGKSNKNPVFFEGFADNPTKENIPNDIYSVKKYLHILQILGFLEISSIRLDGESYFHVKILFETNLDNIIKNFFELLELNYKLDELTVFPLNTYDEYSLIIDKTDKINKDGNVFLPCVCDFIVDQKQKETFFNMLIILQGIYHFLGQKEEITTLHTSGLMQQIINIYEEKKINKSNTELFRGNKDTFNHARNMLIKSGLVLVSKKSANNREFSLLKGRSLFEMLFGTEVINAMENSQKAITKSTTSSKANLTTFFDSQKNENYSFPNAEPALNFDFKRYLIGLGLYKSTQ